MTSIYNLRQFLHQLRLEGEVVDVYEEVDPYLEIAEIHRRVAAADGPVLFFHRVKNSSFPVVTNLFGSLKRVEIAFSKNPQELIKQLISLATHDSPPGLQSLWKHRHSVRTLTRMGSKKIRKAPVAECCQTPPKLSQLPFLTTWPLDGGAFLTLPLVYTEPPEKGPSNLGMYRIQRFDDETTGLHLQIGKGGGYHYHLAESKSQALPVSIFLGGPPALMLSAIAPLPENVPELLLASWLQQKKLSIKELPGHPHPLFAECEFALQGIAPPHERRPEGPFGDHYGYYSWTHDFPVFKCKRLFHRKDAIFPATVVGKPKQEDYYIGDFLQELLSPLFPVVMPGVRSLWSYGETGFHSLAGAVIKERFDHECMTSAFRILGEGQLALTKFLLLTDRSVDLRDFPSLLTTILERVQPEKDLFIFSSLSMDTLDYTGPALNKGSRGVLVGVGEPVRKLPEHFRGPLPNCIKKAVPFSPGCLVLEVPPFKDFQDFSAILSHPSFQQWPLLILTDSVEKATKDTTTFLWTTFTRFEPAADLHASFSTFIRHRPCYQLPILIDARMKPSYPPEVLCDPETQALVNQKWNRYFPNGCTMGESLTGHVC